MIIAAGLIFFALTHGVAAARRAVPDWLVETMLASGVLIYAGVGLAGLLFGGHYLDYFVLDHNPVHGQHRGIFWVEVGVAITGSRRPSPRTPPAGRLIRRSGAALPSGVLA